MVTLIFAIVFTSDNPNYGLVIYPLILEFGITYIYMCYMAREDNRQFQKDCPMCWKFIANTFRMVVGILAILAVRDIRDGTEETFIYLIPLTAVGVFFMFFSMSDETIDGRAGPLFFYENFDYLFLYAQAITLSIVCSNNLTTYNWANILIPITILSFIKNCKVCGIL